MKISYENSARFAFYSLLQLWKHTPKIVSLYVIDLLPFPSAPPLFPSSPLLQPFIPHVLLLLRNIYAMYIFYAIYSQVFVFYFPRAVRPEPLLGFEMNNKYFASNNIAPPLPLIPFPGK